MSYNIFMLAWLWAGQTKMQSLSGFLLLYDSGWAPVQFTHWAYFYDVLEKRQAAHSLGI